jgi:hypothetical protein
MSVFISREGLANLAKSKRIANYKKLGTVFPKNCHPQSEIGTFELLS